MGLIDTGVIPFQQVVVHAANRLLNSGQGDVESWLCISGDESMTISKETQGEAISSSSFSYS